ncbi:MAG: DUF362 domain-containing protein [Phycisphaerae bacterium]
MNHHARHPDGFMQARGDSGAASGQPYSWMRRWFMTNALLSGAFALAWLVLRSGSKPSRFAYPCQQAAFGTAAAAFGVPLVSALISARRRLSLALASRGGRLLAAGGLIVTLGFGAWAFNRDPVGFNDGPHLQPRGTYRAEVFVRENAPGPNGQHYEGLDDLIVWMGLYGTKFYQSDTIENFETGAAGIISSDDVVVIKINYQWPERGGTNVDVLRGLVRRIADHPDTFTGEIVICENAQFNSINNFDRVNNNAEDHTLSPHDVVVEFQAEGVNISHYDWTVRRFTLVNEYSAGDMTDGYIRYAYNSQLGGRVSYPKFQTAAGTYISLKYGLWDPGSSTYDRARLKFINVPVLKSHHATYGATASVKHYMGVVTGELSTNSHSAIANGILGALLGEIQLADLNILDCIWINANPYDGPWTTYSGATRRDRLLASTDPVALDIWAVKNILIPAFEANGYTPPWPYPSADPDIPTSSFRIYLDNSMDQILASGTDVTNDFALIDAYRWKRALGVMGDLNDDFTLDGEDIQAFVEVMLGTDTNPYHLLKADLDADRDVDGDDAALFAGALVAG